MSLERRGPHPDELISASLSGDLTAEERHRLTEHLAGCQTCRDTLEAFGEQRRVIGELRSVTPPRDLRARVAAGIEAGRFAAVPWWRRPALLGGIGAALATVAAAVLAVVLLGDLRAPDEVAVGTTSPQPTPQATAAATPSQAPPSAAPSESAPPPSQAPDPVRPAYTMAVTGEIDNLVPTVRDGATAETIWELDTTGGPPLTGALSPSGTTLAYLVSTGLKGTTEVRITSIISGTTVLLGESASSDDPFVERLAWSREGRYLAFALTDLEGGGLTDVWIYDTVLGGAPARLTTIGSAYVGSWDVDALGERLWISVAGDDPVSYAVRAIAEDGSVQPFGSADGALEVASGVFQPLVNRLGTGAIFWRGRMGSIGIGAPQAWAFVEGGAPYLALVEAGRINFDDALPLFSDVTIGRDAFTSAAIVWAPDSNAFAVWNARWTGAPQSADGDAYPDAARVYFGHLDDERRLTAVHAIDAANIPADGRVIDVALAASGRHLAITVAYAPAGDLDPPRAELLLVARNTGSVPDDVERIGGTAERGWYGPAIYEPGCCSSP